jgi:adenosine/AMP kinase
VQLDAFYREVTLTMELKQVKVEIPEGANVIIGHTHFIKTAEDLYEAMVNSTPTIRFGVAFCEASGPCLVRAEGNDPDLKSTASRNALNIGAGHCFFIAMKGAFPINVLQAVKNCFEVCSIFCATANPVEVILAETDLGRSILGVVDGSKPKGIESEEDAKHRRGFLRKIGYKL